MNILYFDTKTLLPSYKIFRFLADNLNFDYAISTKHLDHFPDYDKLLELAKTPNGIDNFVMINCSPAFMIPEIRRFIGYANYNATHSIFVQNDYSIKPPSQCKSVPLSDYLDYKAESKAFYGFDLWTTCPEGKSALHDFQIYEYVDWNKIVYEGKPDIIDHANRKDSLLYFGSYRNNREEKYKYYLDSIEYPVDIYSPTTVQLNKFRKLLGDNIEYGLKMNFDVFKEYRASIIMQDKRSTNNYHSLPTRFYECLNAGIAMIFDPDCKMTLDTAGIKDYEEYMTNDHARIADILANSENVAKEQAIKWNRDYKSELYAQLNTALRHYPTLNMRN